MVYFKVIMWGLALALAFLFSSMNDSRVAVNFFAIKVHVYLPFLLFSFVFCGALLGYLTQFMAMVRLRYRCRQCRKEVQRLNKELDALRLSVASDH